MEGKRFGLEMEERKGVQDGREGKGWDGEEEKGW